MYIYNLKKIQTNYCSTEALKIVIMNVVNFIKGKFSTCMNSIHSTVQVKIEPVDFLHRKKI